MNLELLGLHARHPAARDAAPDALHGLTLRVEAGEAVAVIGPSGAGKTSLLQVLGCALPPRSGGLRLNGQDPWTGSAGGLRAVRRALFLAPQQPPLPPRQRVVNAVLAGALPHWSLARSLGSLVWPPLRGGAAQAEAALDRFDLADKLWERVDRLSGGERQRVGLARALVSAARLWLIDEPLSALDPTRAAEALRVLRDEAQARGVTLVASLHHVELALAAFPRVLGLREGRLLFDLPAAAVTPERLAALYAHHEAELRSDWVPVDDATPARTAAPPVPMTCR